MQNPWHKLYVHHSWFRCRLTILSAALIPALCTLCCCCLYKVCWNVSEALMLAICVRLYSCLYIVCSKCFRRFHACHMCSILFLPVQSSLMHIFQKLSYLLCGLCLSLSSLTLPQTVRLFNISLNSQAPQQQYTVLSFSSMQRHGHSHKLTSWHALYGITLWPYLSRMHRPNLWYYTVGIPSWASCKRQSQQKSHNTVCSKLRDHTLPLRTCYREVHGNIAREKMVDLQ